MRDRQPGQISVAPLRRLRKTADPPSALSVASRDTSVFFRGGRGRL
jgi:hypothetical protein